MLAFGRHGDDILAIASNNGAPAHTRVVRNLLKRPTATVELGPDKFPVPPGRRPEERATLAKAVPYLESQHTADWTRDPNRRPERSSLGSGPPAACQPL